MDSGLHASGFGIDLMVAVQVLQYLPSSLVIGLAQGLGSPVELDVLLLLVVDQVAPAQALGAQALGLGLLFQFIIDVN